MRPLRIAGSGVHGKEMAHLVARVNAVSPTWEFRGFVTPETLAEVLSAEPDTCFVPDNEWPRAVALPRERLATLIDPSVCVDPSATIGLGCVLYPHGFVGHNARLGDFVFCLAGCTINHDDVLEDRVVLASGVTLAGGVSVGEGAYLGQSCTVRQNLHLGAGCLVGMGAVVVKDVPAGATVVGNPARVKPPSR